MDDDPKSAQEIWETTTGGTTFVNIRDPKSPRAWVHKKVGGRGSKRITLTVEEREFNQELIAYENGHLDPFTNGLLVRISPKEAERGQYEVTDEELVTLLKAEGDAEYTATITGISSEIVLRRMLTLAERSASKYRYEQLKELIDDRYHIGRTQKVVQEMYDDNAKFAGADL